MFRKLLDAHPWLIYVVPLAVFMLCGAFEPKPPVEPATASQWSGWTPPYDFYPLIYSVKILLTAVAVGLVAPGYRQFPWRASGWALAAGIVGAGIWIGLCKLRLEKTLLEAVGLGGFLDAGQRSAYNPLAELADRPGLAYGFLLVRFLGLVALVPLIEEFFLRGFLMRYFVRPDWWRVPFGEVNRAAIFAGTLVPILMHPGEILAAAAWFSLITVLMVKTKNIWDCVIAHAVTNLLLGLYVLASGDWWLM
jgi:hypothetical protein